MERMNNLPYKPGQSPEELEIARLKEELRKERSRNARTSPRPTAPASKPPTARQTTAQRRKPTNARARQSQTVKSTARPKKSLPPMRTPGEQPRDNLGRFASKAGDVLKATARGTSKADRKSVV